MKKGFHQLFDELNQHDLKSLAHLSAAIENKNLKQFDYFEFKQSIHELRNLLDEPTAMKSAFVTAKQVGMTKDNLLESIQHYLRVLSQEKAKFDAALQNQVVERVNKKREEKKKLANHVAAIQQKIKELEAQITEAQMKIDKNDDEVEAAQTKINDTQERFNEAYIAFADALQKDYDTFNKNL